MPILGTTWSRIHASSAALVTTPLIVSRKQGMAKIHGKGLKKIRRRRTAYVLIFYKGTSLFFVGRKNSKHVYRNIYQYMLIHVHACILHVAGIQKNGDIKMADFYQNIIAFEYFKLN